MDRDYIAMRKKDPRSDRRCIGHDGPMTRRQIVPRPATIVLTPDDE